MPDVDFFAELERAIRGSYPKPKMIVLGVPAGRQGHRGGVLLGHHVRFALIENEARIRQAVRGIRRMLNSDAAACS